MTALASSTGFVEIAPVLRAIFGSGTSFTVGHGRRAANRFLAIPGNQGFRWLVPREPAFGMPVLQQWQPYSLKSKAAWKSLLAAYRCGVLEHVPGVQCLSVSEGVVAYPGTGQLDEGSAECIPVVYMGTPGPTRKAVVSLVSTERQVTSVMKVPLEDCAATSILREADALTYLERKPGLAPSLFARDPNRSITVQEFCPGEKAGTEFQMSYLEWLSDLHTSNRTTSLAEHCAAALKRLSPYQRSEFSDVIYRASQLLNDSTGISAFVVHGDFAPWNLKLRSDGTISRAIDWEGFVEIGLPLHDYFHFHYIQSFLFNRPIDLEPLEKAAGRYMYRFGISHGLFRKLTAAYLLSSFAARVVANEDDHAQFYGASLAKVLDDSERATKAFVS